MSFVGSNILAGASGQGGGAGYKIERSLRFNLGDTPRLSKTFASTSTTFTASFWLKRSNLPSASYQHIFSSTGASSCSFEIVDNVAYLYNQAHQSSSVYLRDPSAWYHIVLSVTAGTCTLYINNSSVLTGITGFSYGGYSTIGSWISNAYNLDGYLADIHFIDGQALAPTDFGETDNNGVWQPKEFDGSYTQVNTTTSLSQVGWATSDQANLWDGSTSTRVVGAALNSVGTVTFSPPLTNVTKVEFYAQDYHHFLNGSQITTSDNGTTWHTYYDNINSPITLTSLGAAYTNNTQTIDVYAIRINGSIVNAQTWTPPSGVGIQATGSNSFHLDFADNSSNAALGTDTSGNNNTWTVNNLQANSGITYAGTSTTAVNGEIPNGGTPYWVDILPTNASLDYSGNSFANVHDGSTSTDAYLAGDEHSTGTVVRARFDLRDYSNVTSVKLNTWYPASGGGFTYFAYQAQLLDASKYAISGTQVDLDLTTQGWKTIPVSGSPRFIEISCTSGGDRRLKLYAVEVNGSTLVNSTLSASGNDSLVDTPTNGTQPDTGIGGEVTGSYATLNPLAKSSNFVTTNGNLAIGASGGVGACLATIAYPKSGKWYHEIVFDTVPGYNHVGIAREDTALTGNPGYDTTRQWTYWQNGLKTNGASYANSYAAGDVIGVAFDADAGSLTFYKNGVSQGVNATGLTSTTYNYFPYFPCFTFTANINFGQRVFTYPVSGYKSLNTANLPEPTIADGSKYFDTKLYSGTSSSQALTMANSELSPDFVWIKSRNSTYDNALTDSVRGAGKVLFSSGTYAETTYATSLTSFDSNGFTLGSDAFVNGSSNQFAAWAWDAGTSTVSNTDGSITSQVKANPSAGFSIVSYTGSGANSTIGHGLNAAPEFIITKNRDSGSFNWGVYHAAAGNTVYLKLNTIDAAATQATWQNTTPTSSIFYVGNYNSANQSADDYIAYCFAPVEGYSSFGKFTANASTDGPFVYLGFRPALVVCKKSSNSSIWIALDSERDPNNVTTNFLLWNDTDAEASTADRMDFLSNGFKLRAPGGYSPNETNGDTYIYLAFAEHPFKTARAR